MPKFPRKTKSRMMEARLAENILAHIAKTWIPRLPDEIWLKIMEYLSTSDILRKMARISKRFNRISRDQNLIKRIEFKSFELTFGHRTRAWTDERMKNFYDDFFEVLKNAQKLRFLSLHLEPSMLGGRFHRILIQLSANYEYLEELHIQTRDIGLDLMQSDAEFNVFLHLNLLVFLDRCPKLKILKLENENLADPTHTVPYVLATIASFKSRSLKELHLKFHRTHCNSSLTVFLKTLTENMPQLRSIYIAFNTGTNDQFSTAIAQQRIFQEIISKKKEKLKIQIRDIRYGVHGVGGIIEFFGPATKFLMSIRRALI